MVSSALPLGLNKKKNKGLRSTDLKLPSDVHKCRSLRNWILSTRADLSERDRTYLEENFTPSDYELKVMKK